MRKLLPALLCFLVPLVLSGGELEQQKESYAKQDKALNAIYAKLKEKLDPVIFEQVREDQRDWVGYREYMSVFQARNEDPEQSAIRWETAAAITEGRVEWLAAWLRLTEKKGWAGRYSDSYGGVLEIAEKDGKTWFALSVVRGSSFHLGSIGGEVRINGSTGWFETQQEGEDRPTWLTFREEQTRPGRVKIAGENTSSFHGARAYFDGNYLWTGSLTAEEQKQVIEGKTEE